MATSRRAALGAALVLIFLANSAPAQTHDTHKHRFGNAEKWARVFDDPKRDAIQKPHEVIKALALKPDAVVADIGSGTGYFAARLSHAVPKGKVYGVDLEPDMVRYLAERAKRENLRNVVSLAGTPGDPKLPEKVDLAMMVDVYHHVADRPKYLSVLRGALKPGGRFAVIDFRLDAPSGPPRHERIAPEAVKAELKSAGFSLESEHAFLPQQYFLVFRAPR
jgi:predicted methyltransferase